MAKIQFNQRLDVDVAAWIAAEAIRQTNETEMKVSQADIVTALVRSAMGSPAVKTDKKLSKKGRAIQERIESDVVARLAERDNIDYSDVESTPTTNVAVLKEARKPAPPSNDLAKWRAGRKPLLKPKEQ